MRNLILLSCFVFILSCATILTGRLQSDEVRLTNLKIVETQIESQTKPSYSEVIEYQHGGIIKSKDIASVCTTLIWDVTTWTGYSSRSEGPNCRKPSEISDSVIKTRDFVLDNGYLIKDNGYPIKENGYTIKAYVIYNVDGKEKKSNTISLNYKF